MNKYTPLSKDIQSIILGSVLGDGSLKIHPKYKNARFSFRHSEKQSDYFFWKVNHLKEIASKKCFWRQSKNGKDGWETVKFRFQSKALPSLTELFNLTHPKSKFLIRRKWLNQLTPLSLAIWWQDDGSIIANGRKGVLCTDGFKKSEVQILQKYLKKVWHIQTIAAPKSSKEPDKLRLWLSSSEQLQSFLRIILPHLDVEQMIPKFTLLYHNHQLQQRWISEISKLSKFPIPLVEKYYQQKKSKWKQYRDTENDIVRSSE
jgi:hypothetical protein